jgi:flagellar biosynthetic protein FliQ
MDSTSVIDLSKETLYVMLKMAGPMMLTALVVGVIISFIQALTQIQETTISFIPKIIATFAVMFFMLPFFGRTMRGFSEEIFDRISGLGL